MQSVWRFMLKSKDDILLTHHYFISVIAFMLLMFKSSCETLGKQKATSVRLTDLGTDKTFVHM